MAGAIAESAETGLPAGASPMSNEDARGIFDHAFSTSPETKEAFKLVEERRKAKAEKATGKTPSPVAKAEVKKEEVAEPAKEETLADKTIEEPEATEETAEETTEEAEPEPDRAQTRWSELKKLEKKVVPELKKQIETLTKELETERASKTEIEGRASEGETYKKKLEEAYKHLEVTQIEAHPKFQEAVTNPRNQVFAELMEVATLAKVEPKGLIDAIGKDIAGDGDALEAYIEENVTSKRRETEIYEIAKNLRQIQKRENDLRANSKEALKSLNQEQQAQFQKQQETIAKERSGAAETVVSKFKDNLLTLLPEGHGLDLDAIKGDIQKFDTLTEGEKVYAAAAGYTLLKVADALKETKEKLADALKANAKLRNGAPKTTNGSSATAQTNGAAKDKPDRNKLAGMSMTEFGKTSMDRMFGRA